MAASRGLRAAGVGNGAVQRDCESADGGVVEAQPEEEALMLDAFGWMAGQLVSRGVSFLDLFWFYVHGERAGMQALLGIYYLPTWVHGLAVALLWHARRR